MYHLYAQLQIVMEKPHMEDMAQIHSQKRGSFLGGTMRRIGPRRRGRNWSWEINFTPNESRAPALYVGMLTSSRECLDKKIWPFVHFSASFYVWIRIDLIRDTELRGVEDHENQIMIADLNDISRSQLCTHNELHRPSWNPRSTPKYQEFHSLSV